MFTTVRQQHDDILWEPGHNCFKHFKCIKFVSDMNKNSKVYQKIQYQHLISNKNFIRRKKNLGTILLRTTFDFNRQPIGWFTILRPYNWLFFIEINKFFETDIYEQCRIEYILHYVCPIQLTVGTAYSKTGVGTEMWLESANRTIKMFTV